jgi:hypothetical protein
VEVSPTAAPAVALARAESGRLVDPARADIEALNPARLGPSASFGEPVPVTRGAFIGCERASVADLRDTAARLGARLLVIARFTGEGRERRLLVTLHDAATGREVARFGPSEPSLPIAFEALRQPAPRTP